jgi:EAL domain-containing protein (putative c-di-GMP-specific phosphodiesterase class I)
VAEETSLIVPIGDWTIDQAARLAPNAPGGRVLVNLSPRQLAIPALPQRIARFLAARQLPAAALGFEVTETLLIEHFAYTAEILCEIRQLGCRVGLDDFGTGYSSLGYLRRLPIDFVKVDGSLTADIDADPQARAIVGAIVTMAAALHLDVIAEGVETAGQAAALADLGCGQAQGFYFGRPSRPG